MAEHKATAPRMKGAGREVLDYRDLENEMHDAVNMCEAACDQVEAASFLLVSDQEAPLTAIRDFAKCLAFIAETMDSDTGTVVQRLAWTILDETEKAEKVRGELFRVTHPRRDHFERYGWPDTNTEGGAS